MDPEIEIEFGDEDPPQEEDEASGSEGEDVPGNDPDDPEPASSDDDSEPHPRQPGPNPAPARMSYLTDHGTAFSQGEFLAHIQHLRQTLRHPPVGAHHGNGIAERSIGIILSLARAMLHHFALHWPEVADVILWPLAVLHAVFLHNRLPSQRTGLSPLETFSRRVLPHERFQAMHVWGCPVYVLDSALARSLGGQLDLSAALLDVSSSRFWDCLKSQVQLWDLAIEISHHDIEKNTKPFIRKHLVPLPPKVVVSNHRKIDLQKYTVRVYSRNRPRTLRVTLNHLRTCLSVAQIQVVWPEAHGKVPEWLLRMDEKVVVEEHADNSLNARFRMLNEPPTAAILSQDDDLFRTCDAMDAGFALWTLNPTRMVGYDPRKHILDGQVDEDGQKKWGYSFLDYQLKNHYSFALTRFAFLHKDYLHNYAQHMPASIRLAVEQQFNCEDIAMAFLVAYHTGGKTALLADKWALKESLVEVTSSIPIYETGYHLESRSDCVNSFAETFQLKDKLKIAEYEHKRGNTTDWFHCGASDTRPLKKLHSDTSVVVKKLVDRRKFWAKLTAEQLKKKVNLTVFEASWEVRQHGHCYFQSFRCKSHNPGAIIAGLARSMNEIKWNSTQMLLDLSCKYKVPIHIIVNETVSHPLWRKTFCSPVLVEPQDLLLREELSSNRVVRLAQIRDAQRNRIRELFFTGKERNIDAPSLIPGEGQIRHLTLPVRTEESAIILMDLDLAVLPTADEIMHRAEVLNQKKTSDPDATHLICSAGNHISKDNKRKRPFYYDTFATIFYPDTLTFPLGKRLIQKANQGENPDFIPIHVVNATQFDYTQYTLMQHLRKVAWNDKDRLFPLRSCFGGVALYKAGTWLTPKCRYTFPTEKADLYKTLSEEDQRKTVLRYAAMGEGVPCEHVVFHDCLHRKVFHTNTSAVAEIVNMSTSKGLPRPIMIDPYMLTQWKKTPGHFRNWSYATGRLTF